MDILKEMDANFLAAHSPTATLTKNEINELPLYAYGGNITLVSTPEEEADALKKLNNVTVVGFDTETKPVFRKGISHNPSLIQIATQSEVILFHLKSLALSQRLIGIFENPRIVKAGVAISDDMRTLAKLAHFTPRGLVDLDNAAKHHNIGHQGLRSLAALLLGIRISKNEQCSNWGKRSLTEKQIRYAATDAWISLALYLRMQELNLSIKDKPIQKAQPKKRVTSKKAARAEEKTGHRKGQAHVPTKRQPVFERFSKSNQPI